MLFSIALCRVPGRIEHVKGRRCQFSSIECQGCGHIFEKLLLARNGGEGCHAQGVRAVQTRQLILVLALPHLRQAVSPVPPRLFPEVGPHRLVGDEPKPCTLQGSCPSRQDIPEARMLSAFTRFLVSGTSFPSLPVLRFPLNEGSLDGPL